MGKYYAMYKCPLCNSEFTCNKTPVEIDENEIPDLLGKFVAHQRFAHNPYLYDAPMYMVHRCGNGDGGLAPFIGFRKAQDIQSPKQRKPRLLTKFLPNGMTEIITRKE